MVASKAPRRLTNKEEAFARLVAGGATLTDAYRKAYDSQSPNARINAVRVARREPVVARIKELQTPDEKRLFLTRARKREILLGMAENPRYTPLDRQRAIAIDNKMTGDDRIVVRVEGEITLSAVLSAMQGAPTLPAPEDSFDVETVHPASPTRKNEVPRSADQDQGVAPLEESGGAEGETAGEVTENSPAGPTGPYAEDWSPAFDEPAEVIPEPPKKRQRTYD